MFRNVFMETTCYKLLIAHLENRINWTGCSNKHSVGNRLRYQRYYLSTSVLAIWHINAFTCRYGNAHINESLCA